MFCRKCGAENPDDSLFCQSCGTRFSKTSVGDPIPPAGMFDEEQVLREALAGRYEVLKKLGAGGMANVYYARETALERFVAVKVLPQAYLRNEDFVERFKREAKISAKLEHPNIITIHTIGIEDNLIFFVMGYLPNGSIADRIKSDQALDLLEIIRWGRDMCKALSYAHGRGVIHRDLKPENVMLDENLNAVVTDFGIAFAAEGTRMTRTGTAVGTASYMSPEQAAGKAIDARSDLYSLGVMLYQMATGALPFEATNPASLMYQHVHETPEPPDAKNADLPPWLCDIILKCLQKKPDERYANAADVLAALTDGFKAFQSAIDRQHGMPATETAMLSTILKTVPAETPMDSPPTPEPEKPRVKRTRKKQAQTIQNAPTAHTTEQSSPKPKSDELFVPFSDPAAAQVPVSEVPSGAAAEPTAFDLPTETHVRPKVSLQVLKKLPELLNGLPAHMRAIPVRKTAAVAATILVSIIMLNLLFSPEPDPGFVWLVEPQFDWAQSFGKEGLARIRMNGQYGFVDAAGDLAVEASYEDAWPFEGPFTAMKRNGRWGFIDTGGTVLMEPQFESARGYCDGFIPIMHDGLWGFVNSRGNLTINPQFEDVGIFSEGIAPVFRNGKWGYINTSGTLITPTRYEDAEEAAEGLAPVRRLANWGYVDLSGDMRIEPSFDWAGTFSDGRALIKKGDGWGYIDSSGDIVIPAVFDEATPFYGGFAHVLIGDSWAFIDTTGEFITKAVFAEVDVFSEGFAMVSKGIGWGYIDTTGDIVIDIAYEDARDFTEGLAAVQTPDGWGYIDTTGNIVIEPQFENAFAFTDGIAAVQLDGRWGYIRRTE